HPREPKSRNKPPPGKTLEVSRHHLDLSMRDLRKRAGERLAAGELRKFILPVHGSLTALRAWPAFSRRRLDPPGGRHFLAHPLKRPFWTLARSAPFFAPGLTVRRNHETPHRFLAPAGSRFVRGRRGADGQEHAVFQRAHRHRL